MIQATVDRLGDLVTPERQLILTNKILTEAISQQLPELPRENVIGEPCKRDTAPCVGLAAALVREKDPDGTMVVMPSDHVIVDPESFRDAVRAGEKLIDQDPTRIVTFGIRPSYPAESFGYIEAAAPLSDKQARAFQVAQFREKPARATAEQYLAAGNFFWNSGIFLWRASTILEALEKYEPDMYAHLSAIEKSIGSDGFAEKLDQEFHAITGKSIDYAVMERYQNVVVIEAPFPWDDVGSWQALSRLRKPDENNNTVVGSHVGIDTRDSIIHAEPGHTIVTIDIADLIVVQTPDATLVAPKHAEERLREAVKALEQQQLSDKL